jgi:hypothetical protein
MGICPLDPEHYCAIVPDEKVDHVKAAEISALLVAYAPSVGMTAIMHFQAAVWGLAFLSNDR